MAGDGLGQDVEGERECWTSMARDRREIARDGQEKVRTLG
jgi:hypothetical protein